jgi:HSP20 family molecular chaperone IbpA
MVVDGGLWVSVDASHFHEGTINIWVAPRRMTISGKSKSRLQSAEGTRGIPAREEEIMFREVELPVEVDPSNATACINGKFLEIRLKNAQESPGHFIHQAAA